MTKPKLSLQSRALRYLSAREHSRFELSRKLMRYAKEGDNVEEVLDWLEASNFLSQERFSESLIRRRASRFGNNHIIAELQTHNITSDAMTFIKADLASTEIMRAHEVWRKKFSYPPINNEERIRQMRFLLQRGFSHQTVRATIDGCEDEDNFVL